MTERRRGNDKVERLPRRSAIASLLAMTIIFPSLRASRLSVLASQPAWQSLPLVSLRASRRGNPSLPPLNDLARLLRRSADASLLAMTRRADGARMISLRELRL